MRAETPDLVKRVGALHLLDRRLVEERIVVLGVLDPFRVQYVVANRNVEVERRQVEAGVAPFQHLVVMVVFDIDEDDLAIVGQDLHATDDVSPAVADRDDPRPVGTDHNLALPAARQFLVVDLARVDDEALLAGPLDEIGVVGLEDEAVVDLAHEFRALRNLGTLPARAFDAATFLGEDGADLHWICRGSRLRRSVAFGQPLGPSPSGLVRLGARLAPHRLFLGAVKKPGGVFGTTYRRLALLTPLLAFLGDRELGLGGTLSGGLALLAPLLAFLGDRGLGFGGAPFDGLALLAPLLALLGDRGLGFGGTPFDGFAVLAPLLAFLGDRGLGFGGTPFDRFALPRRRPLGPLALRRPFCPGSPLLVAFGPLSFLPAQQFFLFGRLGLGQNEGRGSWLGVARKCGKRSRYQCEADRGAQNNPKMAFHLDNDSVGQSLAHPQP
ncbi:hypothetical protein [Mesorhizobium sp.]|uniref:hypothetical protein n=1 Tax=Mesorhizobium sp. TaxID=1871066 RepID=UPI00338EE3CF